MKRYLAVLLTAALFAMTLGGCGSKSGSQDENVPEEAASTEEPETPGAEEVVEEVTTDIFVPYYGTWEVKDYVISELSDIYTDELEAYRGKTVTYQADSILVDDQDVNVGSFTYEISDDTYDYDKLTEEYNVNLGEWWNNISEVTKVTVASDTDFFGSQLFIADADTLWIYQDGAFFLARQPEE